MKERPVLFSAPMVRAILDGRKTVTRRVVKPRKDREIGCALAPCELAGEVNAGDYTNAPWAPGERLWVREAFDFLPDSSPDHPQGCQIVYWATGSLEPRTAPHDYNPLIYGHEKVRPSIHMPRWASRITLEITGVRAERLQDISEADALTEGIARHADGSGFHTEDGRHYSADPSESFASLWESINGAGSWDANPWVFVIEFRRLP